MIDRAKAHTNVGGIHIMQIFTDTVPAPAHIAPFAVGSAKDGEIRDLYHDWENLQFKSYTLRMSIPGSQNTFMRRTKSLPADQRTD